MSKKSIEDLIFLDAITAQGLFRTKNMYEPSTYPHRCQMCDEYPSGYKLKSEFVETLGSQTPYIFICEDCLKELEE